MSKRPGEAFWVQHVEAARNVAVSGKVYAEQHGISVKRLYFWQRKLRKAGEGHTVGTSSAAFVALRLPTSATPGCVLLTSGLRLEMAALPAPEWLAVLVREVR